MPPSTHQQREQLKRDQKLDDIKEQVQKGTLVIRKMTDEERKLNPPGEKPTRGRRPRT
jgi:hypothetical protein